MVQLARSGSIVPVSGITRDRSVKLEIEDSFEEEHGPSNKRSRTLSPFQQEWNAAALLSAPSLLYNPLDEPSPLGLRLKKSPSLLDLIQMTLCKGTDFSQIPEQCTKPAVDSKMLTSGDKLKASNFPAVLLRIGNWEYVSRHEGDLVAKCYFAKHKLVWEVLEAGLKSKIEIQWSDIMGLKASFPDDGHGRLNVVLARQPLFFRETNPQPRKHTLWQATADFTIGQASMSRIHFLKFAQGVLNRHFEKLIQCDTRLNFLSQQSEMILDSPFFEPLSETCDFNKPTAPMVDARSPAPDALEGSSGTVKEVGESEVGVHCGGDCVRTPMSMSELMNRIGHCISSQRPSANLPSSSSSSSAETETETIVLENIAHHLLSDTQLSSTNDEKLLMSRIDSLCCLLQDPVTTVSSSSSSRVHHSEDSDSPSPMTRKDSFGELLLHLPRIASLPNFLFNITEDGENQAR